jgi:16S rRNA (cytidine1402-2'-O)-methyltransferase
MSESTLESALESTELENALYIVATPIGNLEDISERAKACLKNVDLIFAEDTRHSARLLRAIDSKVQAWALHDHNERQQTSQVIEQLSQGKAIALVSDAGTPLISDPGYFLVRAVRDAGFKVTTLPGCCAVIAALTIAGLPTDKFIFDGFLPHKSGARLQKYEQYINETRTTVLYESPHRIVDSIKDLAKALGDDREISLVREITKTFETVITGSALNVLEQLEADSNQQRGEFVVLIGGIEKAKEQDQVVGEKILKTLLEELSVKQASALTAKLAGGRKKEWYNLALSWKE